MGIYIYTFRKRTHNVILDGEVQKAHAFAFAHKPSNHWNIDPRVEATQDRQIAMAWDAYEESGEVVKCEETGQFEDVLPLVFVGDKPSEGVNVYRAKRGVWNDGYDFPGELVGTLTKIKNRWHVVPAAD